MPANPADPKDVTKRSRTAICSCGQLSIEVHGESIGVGVCHCLACQRRTGSVFATLAGFSAPYKVSGKAAEYIRRGDGGTEYKFRFCPICGTNLFHTIRGSDESFVLVAVGAFADPNFPPPLLLKGRLLSDLSTVGSGLARNRPKHTPRR